MDGDVIIGDGDSGNSTTRIFDIERNDKIYHNSACFTSHDCILGLDVVIFKNTSQGKLLQEMIAEKKSLEEINDYIDLIILRNVDLKFLRVKIKETEKNCFKKGMKAKQRQFRLLLGFGR